MDRREFMRAGFATASVATLAPNPWAARILRAAGVNLIPSAPSGAPNYWCTWSAQNYMYGDYSAHIDPKMLEGDAGSLLAHNAMNENAVFGKDGWAVKFFPELHQDLYFLLDDGWEFGGSATFVLDTQKFPSFGGSPETRLRKINDAIREKGWRGAALWCRNTPEGDAAIPLVQRSSDAGIRYWKIDGGDKSFEVDRVRGELHAGLATEHVYGEEPLNGDWHADGRFEVQHWDSPRVEVLKRTDVYRTYDTTSILSVPTTLDRVSKMLKAVQRHTEVQGLLNVEDEVYIAAVLGCTMGIMRYPLSGLRPDGDPDAAFAGPRQTKKRMDEIVRAIHWQRIAPAYSAGTGFVRMSSEILTDDWIFGLGETWYTQAIGQLVKQGAPACISRNIELPQIESDGVTPFVYAGRFPNGAVAIATQQRTLATKGWFMPRAKVRVDVGSAGAPIGIFGQFERLTLVFDHIPRGVRVFAQDLKGGVALDVSSEVKPRGKELHIPGNLIATVGLREASSGDLSDPGMVVKLM